MKGMIVLLATVFGTSAWACPDLSGTFVCSNPDGSEIELMSSQRVVNGVTIYSVGEGEGAAEFYADNQWREDVFEDKENEVLYIYREKVWCEDNQVMARTEYSLETKDYSEKGKKDLAHYINDDGDFVSHSSGTVETPDEGTAYDRIEICERK